MHRTVPNEEILPISREIGRYDPHPNGPLCIAFAGFHGNEDVGSQALEQIFHILNREKIPFYGGIIGLRGNLKALKKRVRYIDEDLNRIWRPNIIQKVRKTAYNDIESQEKRELKEIWDYLEELLENHHKRRLIFVDLHSFSAPGIPFVLSRADHEDSRLAKYLNVPVIHGVEGVLLGTAIRYLQDRGYMALAFEGGRHEQPDTVYNLQAGIWLLLEEMGCLSRENYKALNTFQQHLQGLKTDVPKEMELVYRHKIKNSGNFKMEPGYSNLHAVHKQQLLAYDGDEPVHAKTDGYLLMPLYQKQGSDGFFIVRPISRKKQAFVQGRE